VILIVIAFLGFLLGGAGGATLGSIGGLILGPTGSTVLGLLGGGNHCVCVSFRLDLFGAFITL